jgi:prophage regulatory protein
MSSELCTPEAAIEDAKKRRQRLLDLLRGLKDEERELLLAEQQRELRILRRRDVTAKTGLSRSAIYDAIRAGRFPKPVAIGPHSVGWLSHEVDTYIEQCVAARDAKAVR